MWVVQSLPQNPGHWTTVKCRLVRAEPRKKSRRHVECIWQLIALIQCRCSIYALLSASQAHWRAPLSCFLSKGHTQARLKSSGEESPWYNARVCAQSLSHAQLLATLQAVACQSPLPMGFSRQEYWSGLLFPPGDLPSPGIEPASPALADGFFTTEPPRNNRIG